MNMRRHLVLTAGAIIAVVVCLSALTGRAGAQTAVGTGLGAGGTVTQSGNTLTLDIAAKNRRFGVAYITWQDADKLGDDLPRRSDPDAIIVVHGGPVAEPQDTEFILRSTERFPGFDGASSMEHLPTERAMTDQTRRFKAVAFEKASL